MSHRGLQGIDFAAQCDQVARDLEKVHEEAKWTNDGGERDVDYTRVPSVAWLDLRSGFWMARPRSPHPIAGMYVARGRTREHAMREIRIVNAWQLHALTGMNWDDARSYVSRYVYDFEDAQ